jgi:dTDP-4-amino-4,6-dideoxygalactose transaminase
MPCGSPSWQPLNAYARLGYRTDDFPIAERVAAEELSLPMHCELLPEQQLAIGKAVYRHLG